MRDPGIPRPQPIPDPTRPPMPDPAPDPGPGPAGARRANFTRLTSHDEGAAPYRPGSVRDDITPDTIPAPALVGFDAIAESLRAGWSDFRQAPGFGLFFAGFYVLGGLVLTAVAFSLLGFIIGLWAKNFEQLQVIPLMVITPLVFLGGAFYSASMLPQPWEMIARFNPVLHLISGFRWAFFGLADVPVGLSVAAVVLMIAVLLAVIRRIFLTGWRLRE